MVTTFSGLCFAQNDPWCHISYDKNVSHFLSTFDKTKTAWELVRIPSCEHFFVSWCRQSGLHCGKTAYMAHWILHCRFESNFWEILLQQDTCTVQHLLCIFLETGNEVSTFGTCCVKKVQLLLRRLLPIRRVLSIKIKFICITELYVSRLWQICTALWQQQQGVINIFQEFWIQCHMIHKQSEDWSHIWVYR
jgi:hypothetical protein